MVTRICAKCDGVGFRYEWRLLVRLPDDPVLRVYRADTEEQATGMATRFRRDSLGEVQVVTVAVRCECRGSRQAAPKIAPPESKDWKSLAAGDR